MKCDWCHDTDPYGIIPIGYMIDGGTTEVIGFSSPAGKDFDRLMVQIRYRGGGETTRNYIDVFRQFCIKETHETFINTVYSSKRVRNV